MPVQPNHIEFIRQWRNAQIGVLRQSEPITKEQQIEYFDNHIWPDMNKKYPENILLSILEGNTLIGYGGLVHIAWVHRRAEVSFLLKPEYTVDQDVYSRYFTVFLQLIRELAFQELGFQRLHTETYASRSNTISTLENTGFVREGLMRKHVIKNGKTEDSLIHGCLSSELFRYYLRKKLKNILITSASRKVPLIKEMGKAARRINPDSKVVAGDIDKNALSKYVADDYWCMPRTGDSELAALVEGCKKHGISVVYPSRDGELLFWAKNRSLFARHGIDILISSLDSTNNCLDKLAFYGYCREKNLPCIPTAQYLDSLDADSYVVKERYGAGSHKIKLNCSRDEALQHGQLLENPIYQPFVKGKEISIDAWVYSNHLVKGLIMRTRDIVVGGESQVTTTFSDPEIEAEALKAIEHLQLSGHVVMQAIVDNDGNFWIIECNPRFGGASTISIKAGLDSLYWSLLGAIGVDVSDIPFEKIEGQVRQVRVPYDISFFSTKF
ncbi:MAG: GNAT family N-acetyltransferase [Dethiobacteria bacterium]